jgi:arsenite oxidase small subunit
MNNENDDLKKGRRDFIKSAVIAGVAGAASYASQTALADKSTTKSDGRTRLGYDVHPVGKLSELKQRGTLNFNYPDKSSPCVLIKTGAACLHGLGPDKDVVAYSTLCSHQGCPVTYVAEKASFRCPCHFSQFDAEKSGQMICGQSTRKLARIELTWDETHGQFFACGVDGLIYGRQANIL